MSSVWGIDGVCGVCGTDQQAYAESVSLEHPDNFYFDCGTSEGDWFCLACGYGWEKTIVETKNGHLWQETFYYPLDDDGFVNRSGDLTKSMAERKAEHQAKCAARRTGQNHERGANK